jgi:hypothetical protein
MTNDARKKLLEYFTGNFQEGTSPYIIYESETTNETNNLLNTLKSEVGNQ